MELIIASSNQGKLKEFQNLLAAYADFELVSMDQYPELEEIEETGKTFEENARLKAESIAQKSGKMVLADDSGLVVPALGGEPGIHSARYAGLHGDDEANQEKLLNQLQGHSDRSAYFVCCLVLAYPGVDSLVVEGRVHGQILEAPRGQAGFGYDPLFYYPPLDQSFAELEPEVKNQHSHRSQALKELESSLASWLKDVKTYEISLGE